MNPDREQYWDENNQDNQDDELEIVDLPPPEASSVAGRLVAAIDSIKYVCKVSLSAKNEEGEDDEDFELRFVDLAPLAHSTEQGAETAASLMQDDERMLTTVSPARRRRDMRQVRWMRVFSPFTCMLLLIIANLAGSGSAPYQPVIPRTVAVTRPNFADSSTVIIADRGIGISTFDASDQGRVDGWHTRLSDNSTIVIPGVAIGHSNTPGGMANWTASAMPINCAITRNTDAVYTSGHLSLWLVGTSYPYTVVHLQDMTSSNLNTWKGWQLLIGILMKRGFTGPVTLSVSTLSYGPSPSFRGLFDGPPLTSLAVDIRQVPPYVVQSALRSRILWNIPLYLPGAGCYTIQTQWPGGNHSITISAGQ